VRLLLCLVLALVVVAGCAPPQRELSPKETLDRAADELDKATSAHFVLEQQNGTIQLASGVQVGNAEGDVLRPDKLRMKFTLRFLGINAESQLIAIGDDVFLTNPTSGQWVKAPPSTSAPQVLDKDHGVSSLLRQVSNPQSVGTETIDGVQTQHIKGSVPADAFGALTGAKVSGDAVPGDIWVGTADFLPRQVRLEGVIGPADTSATVRNLKLSNYNQDIAIDAPM
jgi:outer membrane lipoprotein-sorting protein